MENIDLGKSANQLWRESGSTLSFKNWVQREKDKGRFLPNKQLLEFNSVEGDNENFDYLIDKTLDDFSKKTKPAKKVGISGLVIGFSVALILGGLIYKIYQKKTN
jgi:hypothetical protein